MVPVILAGHDHEMYIDEAGASTIVKVGCDAEKIGFVDIWWDGEGNVQSSVSAVPASEFPKEPECDHYGTQQDAFVENMMSGTPSHDQHLTTLQQRFSNTSATLQHLHSSNFTRATLEQHLTSSKHNLCGALFD